MTDTRTMTIVEFLEARLAEDEAAAQGATPGPWSISGQGEMVVGPDGYGVADTWDDTWDDRGASPDADHIARHDPARVLREVEAKRRVVSLHCRLGEVQQDLTYPAAADECATCGWGDSWQVEHGVGPTDYPCLTLRALASVYADHPDFDQAWT